LWTCLREEGNPFAVSVERAGDIIGHMLRKISTACSLFVGLFSVLLWVTDDTQEILSKEDLKCQKQLISEGSWHEHCFNKIPTTVYPKVSFACSCFGYHFVRNTNNASENSFLQDLGS